MVPRAHAPSAIIESMREQIGTLDRQEPNLLRGVLAVVLATVAGSLVALAIKPFAPSDSLVLAYLVPVVVVAIRRGLAFALATTALSVLVLNVVFTEPYWEVGPKGDHGFTLAIFAAVAMIISGLAERALVRAMLAESRRRDADLLSELAQSLYAATGQQQALDLAAAGLQRAMGVPDVALRPAGAAAAPGQIALPLWCDDEVVANLTLPEGLPEERAGELARISAGLGSLLAAVNRRIRLEEEARQAEAVRRSDATKTTVLRAISHDLRSPLAALRAAAQGLRSDGLDARSRDELDEMIIASTDELIEVIENLLTLARLDAGAVELNLQWTDVGEIVSNELARRPELEVDVELDELPLVRTDGAQLASILANLLQNAERHGCGQGVKVSGQLADSQVVLSVADSGPGLRGADPAEIFEPFQSSGETGGVGLGLTIVRGFAAALGGTIDASQEPRGGVRFTLRIPAEPMPAMTDAPESW